MTLLVAIGDLEAARTGDRRALERVIHPRQDLRRHAEYHCVINDVEDAVRESLITVSRKLRDLRSLECFALWCREAVLLRDLEGLTNAEMAQRLHITREAVKSRLHRARALAREHPDP